MNEELQKLINGYFDERLSPEEQLRLNTLVKDSAEHAAQFARATLLHDRLHAEMQVGLLSNEQYVECRSAPLFASRTKRWTWGTLALAASLLLAAGIIWQGGNGSSASAAVTALDRMIEAAGLPIDRVYRIVVTDRGPGGVAPPISSGAKGRKPGIDDAELYVRGSDQFVLIRRFADGTTFITGSDGKIGWAAPPRGHVHLSKDTRRFRRAVPGEHEEIPFVDLRAGLAVLRRGYTLDLTAAGQADAKTDHESRLVAVKQSAERPGPEQVEIWFDAAGVAHRIEMRGLPRDEHGVKSVMLELLDRRDLGAEFFSHETHHDADRPIDWE
jgi:hypothetical protein